MSITPSPQIAATFFGTRNKAIIVTVMDEFSRSEVDVELADETFEKEIEVIEEACVR